MSIFHHLMWHKRFVGLIEIFCLLQYAIVWLITEIQRVKNVTPRWNSPPLWPSCTSHHAVLSACHLSIHFHANPVSSSLSISWPHHLSIIILLLHAEVFPLLICASCFSLISDTNAFILSLPFCQPVIHFHSSLILTSFHLLFLLPSVLPPNPPFLCQSAMTSFVGAGLCQCQAIPSNDNVYYQLCLPLPMD